MEKEKEIKRMEFIISSTVHECEQNDCIRNCQFARQKDCKFFRAAKDLQGEGYGDVRAAVREFAGVLRDKISREHSLGTKGYIVGFKEMKQRALADVDALVKEVCGDEYE